jgi:thiol-disulfide isomerase/thioredoxin
MIRSRTVFLRLALAALAALAASGCSRAEPEPKPAPIATEPKPRAAAAVPTAATAQPAAPSALPAGPLVLARGVRIVHAGPGEDASRVVVDERTRAKSDGRDLVVYVGAKWCEPCQSFHKAAQKGDLDADFPDLTLLEFDIDEDRERLATAGYVSQFIPLFVMPDAAGRASDKKFEGSVKGDGAVANIAPRLRALLRK